MTDFVKIIEGVAKGLGDTAPIFSAQGGHSKVYFGSKYVYKITEKKVLDKSTRINKILARLNNPELLAHVPQTILTKALGENSLVVEELKKGDHPKAIDTNLLGDIVDVLYEVHKIEIDQFITNFEGDEVPVAEYWNHQLSCAQQYADKLISSDNLEAGDNDLLEACLKLVEEISGQAKEVPKLVLVYKDVHAHNTLVDQDGELSALIDWDAAMSGPVELEYAVLWSRYPEFVTPIMNKIDLDIDVFVCAGIVQGLRFWKSFTKDSKYVEQQRVALKRLLEIKRS